MYWYQPQFWNSHKGWACPIEHNAPLFRGWPQLVVLHVRRVRWVAGNEKDSSLDDKTDADKEGRLLVLPLLQY